MNSGAVIETIETAKHRIMLQNGIIRVYSKGQKLDIEAAIEAFKLISEKTSPRRYILIDPTEDQAVSFKAQRYTMEWLNANDNVVATVTKNKRSKVLVDSMIKLFGVKFKLKVFTDAEEAYQWLEKVRQKEMAEMKSIA